jgi:signal transduction histidine kinase
MAAGVILLLGLGTAFWRNNRQKQKLQSERIRNFEQQQKIEHLHSKMQGEEEERSRIARELHDGVNVLLSATKMNYAALGKEHKGLPDTKTYGEIMDLLNNMGMELRTITYKLVPELLIQQSLPDAIETFCELIQKGNNLHIELQTYGSFTALPPELCFAVYRIVQELVHNIVKHAHATQVLIALVHQDELLRLTVEDNGNGFDPEKTTKGLGLKSIKSRVKDIDGNITFSSQKDEGTSVEIEVVTSVLT